MCKPKRVMFAGSFDPFHEGHLALIEKAGQIFDEVWVVVSVNVDKPEQTSLEERYRIVKKKLVNYSYVFVKKNSNLLTVEYAQKHGISFLLRGIRNVQDYQFEDYLARINKSLNPQLQTIFFFADETNKMLSSTVIKEVEKFKASQQKTAKKNQNKT